MKKEARWITGESISDDEIVRRMKSVNHDWKKYKGGYYDRYLMKLLDKYDVTLEEYYKYENGEVKP